MQIVVIRLWEKLWNYITIYFNFYKDNGNLKEIKKFEYHDLYNNLSFGEKFKLYLKNNKTIYDIYYRVKYGKKR